MTVEVTGKVVKKGRIKLYQYGPYSRPVHKFFLELDTGHKVMVEVKDDEDPRCKVAVGDTVRVTSMQDRDGWLSCTLKRDFEIVDDAGQRRLAEERERRRRWIRERNRKSREHERRLQELEKEKIVELMGFGPPLIARRGLKVLDFLRHFGPTARGRPGVRGAIYDTHWIAHTGLCRGPLRDINDPSREKVLRMLTERGYIRLRDDGKYELTESGRAFHEAVTEEYERFQKWCDRERERVFYSA